MNDQPIRGVEVRLDNLEQIAARIDEHLRLESKRLDTVCGDIGIVRRDHQLLHEELHLVSGQLQALTGRLTGGWAVLAALAAILGAVAGWLARHLPIHATGGPS